jgi:hypothetical protein
VNIFKKYIVAWVTIALLASIIIGLGWGAYLITPSVIWNNICYALGADIAIDQAAYNVYSYA